MTALIGAQVSDHVFLLMTDASVELLFSNSGSVQLGADVGVAVGPLGRALEADFGAAPGSVAPIYTYSLSKGLYAGISLDGKVVVTRDRVNEKFYGRTVSGTEILQGLVPTPPAARPLYEALQRCHIYATDGMALSSNQRSSMNIPSSSYPHAMQSGNLYAQQPPQPTNFNLMPSGMTLPKTNEMEYGELPEPIPMYPPATNDQHSYAGLSHMSDITSDPGY
jgi:SH3 domain-containing YSC84-like protein 1